MDQPHGGQRRRLRIAGTRQPEMPTADEFGTIGVAEDGDVFRAVALKLQAPRSVPCDILDHSVIPFVMRGKAFVVVLPGLWFS